MERALKYELTPEHRAQLAPWADKWIANAMSTQPMTEEDRAICRKAVAGMYAAAKLPPPKHIVFVPSPFVLAFAGGFAASISDTMASVLGACGNVTEPQAEANAHLIAAAPDLYEALKGLMPANVCLTNPAIGDDVIVPCDVTMGELRRCVAALARAEGRS